jgi:hypothetical protein
MQTMRSSGTGVETPDALDIKVQKSMHLFGKYPD